MKKISAILLSVILLIGLSGCSKNETVEKSPNTNNGAVESSMTNNDPLVFMYSADLTDVTIEQNVNSLDTQGEASGEAQMLFNENYHLNVDFRDLPDLTDEFFYEGWAVRKGDNLSVISTGELEKEDEGVYTNVYMNSEDLSDHLFYVLTIEPDDGDPAPAEHVLEGTFSKK